MSEQHPDQKTLDTAKDLTGALNDMAAEVKRLRTYGRRNRKWIVFDIAITVLLAVVTVVAVHASQSAHDATAAAAAATQNSRSLCLSSNVARAQQIELWDYALGLSGGKPRTVQQQKTISEFKAHLEVIFQPRNCSHVNPGNP